MKGSIKQKFPFPGLTSLKSRVVLEQVAVLTERLKIVQKETITKTRQAYWNLVFIEQSIGITSETVDALIRLRGVATALYTSGATSFQDILKINIKLELLKEDLATLLSQKKTIEAGLCELLNLSAGTALGKLVFSDPLKKIPEPEVLFPLARQNRQELSLIRHRIARVQTMIEMTESMVHEPFSLGFSRFEDEAILSVGTGSDKSSFPEKSMASMKNSSPLNSWYGIDYPWLNQTKLNLLSLKQTFVEAENATDRMVREAWFSVDKNRRELDTYQNRISALSKSAVDVTTREYEAGSIPFPQVIDAYTSWLRVNLTIAKRKADLGSSIATLEQMIGISF
jgi:outer membrane protein TolC